MAARPTFLMTTGYEQVRSAVAELAGDHTAAREVRLKLPESGVCRTGAAPGVGEATGCCGGAPKADASACCVADEVAKSEGKTGCGCGSETRKAVPAE